jgi:hypothetical protein
MATGVSPARLLVQVGCRSSGKLELPPVMKHLKRASQIDQHTRSHRKVGLKRHYPRRGSQATGRFHRIAETPVFCPRSSQRANIKKSNGEVHMGR